MKKFIILIPVLFFSAFIYSQQLGQVTFSNGEKLQYISFITDQNVLIRISDEGKILEWGMEVMSDRYNYYSPKLQPFMARTDYYDATADSAYRGKVKSIGTCYITYYDSYERDSKPGKLKSIGNSQFDYYDNFAEKSLRGKLKSMGAYDLQYYSPYEDESIRGKLKSIGSTAITYYSSFEDKNIKGKIKSIGGVPYAWYTSFELRNGLKTGQYRQNIGGVTFIVQ